jgi:hypothetical protein
MAALEPLPTCTHVQCSHTKVRTHAPESVRSTVCRDAATTLFNLQSSASPRFFVAFNFSFLLKPFSSFIAISFLATFYHHLLYHNFFITTSQLATNFPSSNCGKKRQRTQGQLLGIEIKFQLEQKKRKAWSSGTHLQD